MTQYSPKPVANKYNKLSTTAKNIENPSLLVGQSCKVLIFVHPFNAPPYTIENTNHAMHSKT